MNGQGWIDAANCWEHGPVANPEIGYIPRSAVGVDNACARVFTHARGAIEVTGVIFLVPDLPGTRSFERLPHEAKSVTVHALVVVAPGISDVRDAKSVLIALVCKGYLVALLRQVFTDDL